MGSALLLLGRLGILFVIAIGDDRIGNGTNGLGRDLDTRGDHGDGRIGNRNDRTASETGAEGCDSNQA